MELSILLAKVTGLYLMITYLSVISHKKMMNTLLKDFTKHLGFSLFGGAIALIIGLLIVIQHNIWSIDWIGLITLLGWLVVIKGAALVLFPKQTMKWSKGINEDVINVVSLVMIVLGAYLAYMGFTA